jgi:hypothetical protein
MTWIFEMKSSSIQNYIAQLDETGSLSDTKRLVSLST